MKYPTLTKETLRQQMDAAGWDVQDNSSVLSPREGPLLSCSTDGTRGYLHLRSGVRTVFDARTPRVILPPPERTVNGARVLAPEVAFLRDETAVTHAAALITELGETHGALMKHRGYRGTIVVRTGGTSVILTPAFGTTERVVRFLQDPSVRHSRRGSSGVLQAMLALTSAPGL